MGNTPSLPPTTGPAPVGSTSLWLKDTARPDPWAAGVNIRELMVSLWYPAKPSGGPRVQYMTKAEAKLQLGGRGILHLRGEAQPLLERGSALYPEVSFCSPGG